MIFSLKKIWMVAWLLIMSVSIFGPVLAGETEGELKSSEKKAEKLSSKPSEVRRLQSRNSLTSSICLVDDAAVEDIRKIKEENEFRKKELDSREEEIKAREKALTEELKKLNQARESVDQLFEKNKKVADEKVAKVVDMLLTMSPKAAAKVLNTLDDQLAVSAISQMDTQKLSKIMNVLDSNRSSKLSELMAGVVRAKSTPSKTESVASSNGGDVTTKNKKGGEINNGNHEQNFDSAGKEHAGNEQKKSRLEEGK